MKKPFLVLFPILVIALVALFYLKSPTNDDPDVVPAHSGIAEATKVNDSSSVSPSTDQQTFAEPDPMASPIVGRRTYSTGIKVDRRVQINGEGKRTLTEGKMIADKLHSPETSVEEDLENIEQILGLYRLSFEQNPVAGDNQMVMEALTGDNAQGLVVFPADHPDLDATGQLLDRWDTPYFFHALSGTQMEIFSAGPDKSFNTSDDVQFTTRNGNPLTGAVDDSDDEKVPW